MMSTSRRTLLHVEASILTGEWTKPGLSDFFPVLEGRIVFEQYVHEDTDKGCLFSILSQKVGIILLFCLVYRSNEGLESLAFSHIP